MQGDQVPFELNKYTILTLLKIIVYFINTVLLDGSTTTKITVTRE